MQITERDIRRVSLLSGRRPMARSSQTLSALAAHVPPSKWKIVEFQKDTVRVYLQNEPQRRKRSPAQMQRWRERGARRVLNILAARWKLKLRRRARGVLNLIAARWKLLLRRRHRKALLRRVAARFKIWLRRRGALARACRVLQARWKLKVRLRRRPKVKVPSFPAAADAAVAAALHAAMNAVAAAEAADDRALSASLGLAKLNSELNMRFLPPAPPPPPPPSAAAEVPSPSSRVQSSLAHPKDQCWHCHQYGHWFHECPNYYYKHKDDICFNCNQRGHWAYECPHPPHMNDICYYCNKRGHHECDCPDLLEEQRRRATVSSTSSS